MSLLNPSTWPMPFGMGSTKEQRYVNKVRSNLHELSGERIKLLHHLSVVQAQLEANAAHIRILEETALPAMQEVADKIKATGSDA